MLALVIACDAGVKPGSPTVAPDPPPKPAKLAPVERLPDLAYLPASSALVVHVDVATLRKSGLWPTYEKDIERGLLPRMTCDEYAPIRQLATIDIGVMID